MRSKCPVEHCPCCGAGPGVRSIRDDEAAWAQMERSGRIVGCLAWGLIIAAAIALEVWSQVFSLGWADLMEVWR